MNYEFPVIRNISDVLPAIAATSGASSRLLAFRLQPMPCPWDNRKFVARFKHRGPVTKAKFLKTLIKHYSVEEYFSRLGGTYNPHGEAPLQILKNDGILVFEKDELGRGYFILDGKVL